MSTDGGSNPRPPSRWDRPPPPHDWRWVVGNIGKVLIATGLLMFGFVAYQLWGTGIEYAQAQDDLDAEFEELLATYATTVTVAPPTTPRSDPPVAAASPVTTLPPTTTALAPPPAVQPVRFEDGDAVARLEIPSIGLDSTVVEGVASADLKRGPGHYPDTPLPGQLGNAAIAGHRTTYGEPFADLDRVAPGDEIIVTTVEGRFVYRMTSSEIVAPSASEVVATTDPSVARLTLTTCHPRWTARQRLIVFADLDLEASAAPQEPVIPDAVVPPPAPDATLPGDPVTAALPTVEPVQASSPPADSTAVPATSTVPAAVGEEEDDDDVSEATADAFDQGWFDDDGAFAQVALWGTLLTAIAVGAYLLSRATRHNWIGAVAGIVPFVVVLYFFFQNVNRLLPAAL